MAYNPISGSPVQFSNENNELAVDYYLKFYIANTTTPLSMATDADGTTTLVKCKLNSEGFPITNPLDDSTVFIPYVNQNFRYVIYKNETDADNNTTANALVNVAEVSPLLEQDSDWKISQTGDYFTYGGTANAITLTSVNTTPATSLVAGQKVRFRATAANTGATTINVDGLGATTCVTVTGVALPADYIRTDVDTEAVYDGTNYVVSRKVESGSNANGEYTRWEDGTQNVSRQDTVNIAANAASGPVFVSLPFGSELYAQPFTSVEYTNFDVFSDANSSFWIGNAPTDPTLTNFGEHRLFDSVSAAAEDYEVYQFAKGKWY